MGRRALATNKVLETPHNDTDLDQAISVLARHAVLPSAPNEPEGTSRRAVFVSGDHVGSFIIEDDPRCVDHT